MKHFDKQAEKTCKIDKYHPNNKNWGETKNVKVFFYITFH